MPNANQGCIATECMTVLPEMELTTETIGREKAAMEKDETLGGKGVYVWDGDLRKAVSVCITRPGDN